MLSKKYHRSFKNHNHNWHSVFETIVQRNQFFVDLIKLNEHNLMNAWDSTCLKLFLASFQIFYVNN